MHSFLSYSYKRRFIHCTGREDALINILCNGLVIYPCERKVLGYLTNHPRFEVEEPQKFGMVCVHGFRILPNKKFLMKYGPFGIELSPNFVLRAGFRKVDYVSQSGLRTAVLRQRFDDALRDLEVRAGLKFQGSAFNQMAYTNKAIAGLAGATKWVQILSEFEYMEPDDNRFESEWRFTRNEPMYYDERPKSQFIMDINDPEKFTKYWNTIKLSRNDVLKIFVPKSSLSSVINSLPSEFSGHGIVHAY